MFKKDGEDTLRKIERMYSKYKNLMHREAYNILKDDGLAEDAVQQSFIKVIKNIEKLDEENIARTRNYLVIICRNTAIDIYKNRLYLNSNSEFFDYEVNEENETTKIDPIEPSQVIIGKETVEKIAKHIEKLPQKYRDIIMLENLYENTKEEIAELLGLNYETVKKRSQRARKMLADSLRKEEDFS